MNYGNRVKRLEAELRPPRAGYVVICSDLVADERGGWKGIEYWKPGEESRQFHVRRGEETITECRNRTTPQVDGDLMHIEIVPKDPRWLTPQEYAASKRTDLPYWTER